jgi:hypothetical protein
MLFPEEDAPHLKAWIVKRLENTYVTSCPFPADAPLVWHRDNADSFCPLAFHRSDADADVLADYVLALLRHDGDVKDVRKLCEEEIPDFLKEGAFSGAHALST